MPKMSDGLERERERYETAGVDLASAIILLDTQVRLRIEQAIKREPRLENLLTPALNECRHTIRLLGQHRDTVAAAWEYRQSVGWRARDDQVGQ